MYKDINNCYPLNSNKKRKNGCCGIGLIIVNFFKKFKIVRNGAEEEVEVLKQLFASFNLEVREHTELTKDQIVEQLSETANDPNLSSDSMIAIAISSHGVEEGLLGINIEDRLINRDYKSMDDCISPRQIQEIFNGENCKALAGKPKLFLLNGCRGSGVEHMIEIKGEKKDKLASDAIFPVPSSVESIATTCSDFFVIYSSFLGKMSIRSTTTGSLFIVEFSKAYAEYGQNYPIESIMPTINRNLIIVCTRLEAESKQSCIWESTCTRSLRIPPPLKGRIPYTEVRDDPRTISPTHKPDTNNPLSSTGEQVSYNIRPSGSEKVSNNPIPTLTSASQGQQATGNPTHRPSEQATHNPTSYPTHDPALREPSSYSIPPDPTRLMHSSMEKGIENPISTLASASHGQQATRNPTHRPSEQATRYPTSYPTHDPALREPSSYSIPPDPTRLMHSSMKKGIENPIPTLAFASHGQQATGNPTHRPSEQATRYPTSYPTHDPALREPSSYSIPPDPTRLMHSSMEKGIENPISTLASASHGQQATRNPTHRPSEQATRYPTSYPTHDPALREPSSYSIPPDPNRLMHSSMEKGIENPISTLASASHGQQATRNPTHRPNEQTTRYPTSYPAHDPALREPSSYSNPPDTRPMHSSMKKGIENPKYNFSGLVVAKSGEIYVTDPDNECIWIFPNDVKAEVPEFPSNKFSVRDHGLKYCHGICIKDDFLFVTCDTQILKLDCTSGLLLDSHLNPTSLTGLDTYGDKIYVCEQFTCQILVLDVNFKIPVNKLELTRAKINFKRDCLLDIKVFAGEIYVLISGTEYAIQMFDKEGGHIHNVISSSSLKKCNFFTMNRDKKIFAGDLTTNELKVFSNESVLLSKREVFGENPGDLITIGGIDINSNNEVVIACICNTKCVLRKF